MTSKITMTYQCLLDMGVNWKRGGNQHRILYLLANSPEGEMVTAMRTKAGMGSGGDGYKNVRSTLAQLRALGLVLEVPSTDRYKKIGRAHV